MLYPADAPVLDSPIYNPSAAPSPPSTRCSYAVRCLPRSSASECEFDSMLLFAKREGGRGPDRVRGREVGIDHFE